MNLIEFFEEKQYKPSQKTAALAGNLINGKVLARDLIAFAAEAKDPQKATCIEAVEYVCREKPEIVNAELFDFIIQQLNSKAPRVKWESAKVIGHCAHRFVNALEEAIQNLLQNSSHPGTVVRWSVAYALSQIFRLRTKHNKTLLTAIETILKREEKNSIRKIYLKALKETT
ncbi:MAG TPA: hypothetical protein PLQ93_05550 [Bacteroidia bacterium]|nr:hypothetical protein [Bacteroidia bacterium]